jgi:hypothetical protein
MANVTAQLFSFSESVEVLRLFGLFLPVFKKSPLLVFPDHLGRQKTVSIRNLLDERFEPISLNEGYLRGRFFENGGIREIRDIIVHFSVSPKNALWASPQLHYRGNFQSAPIVRYAQSLERAANLRRADPFPTVVEATFRSARLDVKEFLREVQDYCLKHWTSIQVPDKYAAIDVGGDWLFFPKSGFNPNASGLGIFFQPGLLANWHHERERHNISITQSSVQSHPEVIFHRQSPWHVPTFSERAGG